MSCTITHYLTRKIITLSRSDMHIIMLECEQSVRGDDMAGGLWFFDVLGIAPTKDKTAIKRAFSRLAHETNPEDDQEGYIKLHDAYRVALAYADGKHIQVIDEDEVSHVNAEEMDFSSLKIFLSTLQRCSGCIPLLPINATAKLFSTSSSVNLSWLTA